MEPLIYKRRFEELQRCVSRIQKLYDGAVIIGEGEDSFQSPKDLVMNFFRVCYELKEALKDEPSIPSRLKGFNGDIEQFCNADPFASLSIDIANQTKHGVWRIFKRRRTNKKIGQINTHVYLFSSDGRNRTELTIEIDGNKDDCLAIIQNCLNSWRNFLQKHNLL